jgi:two-component system sensor kinase FixL
VLSWRQRKDRAGTKMTHRARSLRTATSALLPVTTAALAIAILVAQVRTSEKLTAGLFYVLVVLLAARFCSARGVVLVGVGCIGLTLLAFFLPGLTETHAGNVGLKASIAAAVIGLTTFLALKSRSAEATLRERAALLDLTHDSIVARRFDDNVITYWSRGAEELYGWPRADAVGSVGSELGRTTAPCRSRRSRPNCSASADGKASLSTANAMAHRSS